MLESNSINGSLNIGGSFANSDISNLDALNRITHISGDLNITFNGNLKDLSGLQNILFVGGNIFITNNALLGKFVCPFIPLLSAMGTSKWQYCYQ